MENREKIERLRTYLRDGYVLHGSKHKADVLEPHQAADINPDRTVGKALAIYAEDMDIRIPILMALFDQADDSIDSWESGYHSHGPEMPIVITGKNCTFTRGFVYVLPKDSFEQEGNAHDYELISRTPVTPIVVIEVDASILDVLEGIDNRIAD